MEIVHAAIFLDIRGDVEDLNLSKNPGNFLALLKTFAETNKVLFSHHSSPRAKNALIFLQDHGMKSSTLLGMM